MRTVLEVIRQCPVVGSGFRPAAATYANRTAAMPPSIPSIEVVISNGEPCYQVMIAGMAILRHDRWQAELLLEQFRERELPPDWYDHPLGCRSVFCDDDPEPDPGV